MESEMADDTGCHICIICRLDNPISQSCDFQPAPAKSVYSYRQLSLNWDAANMSIALATTLKEPELSL